MLACCALQPSSHPWETVSMEPSTGATLKSFFRPGLPTETGARSWRRCAVAAALPVENFEPQPLQSLLKWPKLPLAAAPLPQGRSTARFGQGKVNSISGTADRLRQGKELPQPRYSSRNSVPAKLVLAGRNNRRCGHFKGVPAQSLAPLPSTQCVQTSQRQKSRIDGGENGGIGCPVPSFPSV